MSIAALVRTAAERFGARIAVQDDTISRTFAQLSERAHRLAVGLRRSGVPAQSRVMCLLPNSVDAVEVDLALAGTGEAASGRFFAAESRESQALQAQRDINSMQRLRGVDAGRSRIQGRSWSDKQSEAGMSRFCAYGSERKGARGLPWGRTAHAGVAR